MSLKFVNKLLKNYKLIILCSLFFTKFLKSKNNLEFSIIRTYRK